MTLSEQLILVITLVGFIGGVVGWFVRLENRLNHAMTRQEHTEVCDRKHEELKEKLVAIVQSVDTLRSSMEAKEAYSSQQRHKLRDLLQRVEIKVALLSRKELPKPPEEEDAHG